MSPSTLTQTLLSSLLDSPAIVEVASQAGGSVLSVLREHFTFTASEITKAYQEGCGYAFVAISVGLDAPDSLLKTLRYPKITREFAAQIETHYWQPFVQINEAVQKQADFRKLTIQSLKKYAKKTDKFFEIKALTEEDLSALVSHRQNLAITDVVLEQMQRVETVDEHLAAFLRFDGLLGDSVLFFFRELIRQDPRLKDTQNALQQEHICLELEHIQEAIADLKALQAKSSFLFDPHRLQHFETIEASWQTHHQHLLRFQNRFENQLDKVLNWVQDVDSTLIKLDGKLDEVQQTGLETKDLVELLFSKLDDWFAQRGLSTRAKPGDELRQYDNESLFQIETWVKQFGRLPSHHPLYSQVSLKMGTALSSTGDLEQAEQFFQKAIEKTNSPDEKRLAYFNLFQVRWRHAFSQKTVSEKTARYAQALEALKNAVKKSEPEIEQGYADPKVDQRYALHDINKGYYPYEKMLGAGGMGCAFLCHNQNELTAEQHPFVVVKCFWENISGNLKNVFKEPFTLNKVAGDTVPKALDYGYTDNLKQQGPYFVTEYIEGAIDGEAWLETQGPLDFRSGQQIALQLAHGLQRAHEQGIYHLDLKPANLLLKREPDRLVVKIIDFGLARIAPSLRDKAEQRSGTRQLSAFGQAIFGTWEYAPPEQQGYAQHFGKPAAQSDLFAFGKTLYRLLTGELPLEIEDEALAKAPQWYTLLSHCTRQNPAKRPKSAKEVITLLEALKPNKPASTQKSDGIPEDNKAWQTACEHNTLEAYQAYLKGKTLKRHLEKAKACLQALEKEKQTQLRREAERKDKAAQREEAKRQKTTEKLFQFEVVTIRLEGGFLGFGQKIIKNTKRHEARYQTEDLGNGVLLEMVYIPGGTFMMGAPKNEEGRSSDEGPQHKVTIKPFLMGKYPITQAQWIAVMGKNPSHFKGDNRPVESVSWHDGVEFCKRLFDKTGKAYRLPSESEWEYACRAGTTTPFYFGETITTDLANYNGKYTYASGPKGVYRGETTEVGSFPPNAFGLYDMHGNVWEWCADLGHDNYDGAPTDGSAWLENKSDKGNLDYLVNNNVTVPRPLRGGSFIDIPGNCRAADRGRNSSGNHDGSRGFRGCADLAL